MLEVNNLTARYGRAQILNGMSLELAGQEVVALLGRNGAGKTTTMKCIMGLVAAKAGEIRYDGRSLMKLAPHMICRAGIGDVVDRDNFDALLAVEQPEDGAADATESVDRDSHGDASCASICLLSALASSSMR